MKRENFVPAIELIKERMDVLQVDGGVDYRLRALEHVKVYHTPLGPDTDRAIMETFHQIAEVEDEDFDELEVDRQSPGRNADPTLPGAAAPRGCVKRWNRSRPTGYARRMARCPQVSRRFP